MGFLEVSFLLQKKALLWVFAGGIPCKKRWEYEFGAIIVKASDEKKKGLWCSIFRGFL